MATTTNLSITLPTVGGDNNAWGTVNNNAITAFDAIFAASGTSVSMNVGTGKTLTIAGALAAGSATSAALPTGTTINGVAAVNLSATQTLTNKTLTTPVFSGVPTGTVTSGTDSPTITAVSNCSGVSATTAQYLRVGNTVTVSGRFSATASLNAAITVRLTLPIASTFANNYECAGACSADTVASSSSGYVRADVANAQAEMAIYPGDTNPRTYYYTYTYQVI